MVDDGGFADRVIHGREFNSLPKQILTHVSPCETDTILPKPPATTGASCSFRPTDAHESIK